MTGPPPPCGTMPAYQRHNRLGEPIDADCRRARNKYNAERRTHPIAGERMRAYNRARHRALERLRRAHMAEFYRLFREEQDRGAGS